MRPENHHSSTIVRKLSKFKTSFPFYWPLIVCLVNTFFLCSCSQIRSIGYRSRLGSASTDTLSYQTYKIAIKDSSLVQVLDSFIIDLSQTIQSEKLCPFSNNYIFFRQSGDSTYFQLLSTDRKLHYTDTTIIVPAGYEVMPDYGILEYKGHVFLISLFDAWQDESYKPCHEVFVEKFVLNPDKYSYTAKPIPVEVAQCLIKQRRAGMWIYETSYKVIGKMMSAPNKSFRRTGELIVK